MIILSFLVVSILFLKANGQNIWNFDCDLSAANGCSSAFFTAIGANPTDVNAACQEFLNFVRCHGRVCPDGLRPSLSLVQSTLDLCVSARAIFQVFAQDLISVRISGDPHMFKDGKHHLCNNGSSFNTVVYQSDFTQIQVNTSTNSSWPNPQATSVVGLKIVNIFTGKTFVWPFEPYVGSEDGITVTVNTYKDKNSGCGVKVIPFGTIGNGGFLNLHLKVKKDDPSAAGWGSATGCGGPETRRSLRVADHAECAGLEEPYKSSCNYDIEATGGNTFTQGTQDIQNDVYEPFPPKDLGPGDDSGGFSFVVALGIVLFVFLFF